MTMKGYFGTYTKRDGEGFYQFDFNEKKGVIESTEVVHSLPNSTYLAHSNQAIYAIYKGEHSGIVAYDRSTHNKLNDCLYRCGSGCYLAVTKDQRYVLEASYGDGECRLYKLNEDGSIHDRVDVYKVSGNGPHERQDAAHTHFLDEAPDGYVIGVDLGADKLLTFKIEDEHLNLIRSFDVPEGAGPRHIAWNTNGDIAYVFTELSNEILVYRYQEGMFEMIERHSTLPVEYTGHSQGAAIRLSHDGKHLYASNRGHQSIAIFGVNGADLNLIDIVSTGGDWPRDFNITKDDQYLIVAHEKSDNVTTFKRDEVTGRLQKLEDEVHVPEAVCVMFT